ncbi:hypothetical protein RMR16_009240 [Agrobacterium sp. rho-13.3]|jgi:uncharacterized membrane protein|uniref:hypothetical protein n=1 Tax=Agrobacterium sp. rho-13.3 TaxID=3072980 RepID=UPI002A0C1AF5|nr:hypothetical protein [Agrobacterium sp. rho-13.3]MDX8308057.1 hypothetical protein [Agrobacterium sp. rho-13.3]
MFLNDRNSADRLRTQRMLFSLWMALAALMVIITMAAGLATTSHATEMVDQIHTSAIAAAPISKASDRIFVIALVVTGFVTMAIGGIVLTLNSIRETSTRHNRD